MGRNSDPIRAAGAVVLREHDGVTEVALVHRDRYQDWTIPKGKLEKGELACEAAVREVAEETGCRISLGAPLDRTSYPVPDGTKLIDWWVATLQEQASREPDAEISAVQWFPVDQALETLTHEHDRTVLRQAVSMPATTAVVVVRHAKAVKRSDWGSGEDDRPITSYGRRQARRLCGVLGAYGITVIHSSPWLRCVQTITPYLTSSQRPEHREPGHPDTHDTCARLWPELTEAAGHDQPEEHRQRWRELADEAVRDRLPAVICGHRPTLPVALEVLGIAGRKVRTAELVVVHLDADAVPVAHEWHRPDVR